MSRPCRPLLPLRPMLFVRQDEHFRPSLGFWSSKRPCLVRDAGFTHWLVLQFRQRNLDSTSGGGCHRGSDFVRTKASVSEDWLLGLLWSWFAVIASGSFHVRHSRFTSRDSDRRFFHYKRLRRQPLHGRLLLCAIQRDFCTCSRFYSPRDSHHIPVKKSGCFQQENCGLGLREFLVQEPAVLLDQFAVDVEFAALAQIADHVPMQAATVFVAGFAVTRAERQMDRAADLFIE